MLYPAKKKDVLNLPYESYIANRDSVLTGFRIAKEFLLRDQCVFRQRDLPYTTQLIPFSGDLCCSWKIEVQRAEHD